MSCHSFDEWKLEHLYSTQINEDSVVYKNGFEDNRVGSVVWLAWRADTGNGLCAEQTQRLSATEARETAPPPSSENEKNACVYVLSFQKAVIYLIQDTAEKSTVAF